MAITFSRGETFTQQRKRDQILILLFFGVLLVTSIVLWQGFFKKGAAVLPAQTPVIVQKKVELRFDVLKGKELEELQSRPNASPLPEKIGRENPFVPFEGTKGSKVSTSTGQQSSPTKQQLIPLSSPTKQQLIPPKLPEE